jgi:hypothetical protein
LVYVSKFAPSYNFWAMGLGVRDGWRVRSCSSAPVETIAGPRMVGYTPVGSLRRIDRLPPDQQRALDLEMAHADFKEAMADLARLLNSQIPVEELEHDVATK